MRDSKAADFVSAAGFRDSALWEGAKANSDTLIHEMIDRALENTTVTIVLLGAQTAHRRYIDYEIDKSVERGNGILGIRIHMLKNEEGKLSVRGTIPRKLLLAGAPVYDWDPARIGSWIEIAATRAGKGSIYTAKFSPLERKAG